MAGRSVYHPNDPGKLTGGCWDNVAALDPLLPTEGAFAVLGLGGGTVAHTIHKYWPQVGERSACWLYARANPRPARSSGQHGAGGCVSTRTVRSALPVGCHQLHPQGRTTVL